MHCVRLAAAPKARAQRIDECCFQFLSFLVFQLLRQFPLSVVRNSVPPIN
jgi:hypothetical protein